MTVTRDPDRLIRAFVLEGEERLDDRVYDGVRAAIEHRKQRVVIGPWRFPEMNRTLAYGLAAAAVVVIAIFVGAQLIGSPGGGFGDSPTTQPTVEPTAEPTAEATPSPSAAAVVGEGPFVVTQAADPVQVTVEIPSSGWYHTPAFDLVGRDDDGLDPPETVGGALVAWAWPSGTEFVVYGDPCQWASTAPDTLATTPGEIAAAFAAQTEREPTEPEDVTVGGYTGVALTLQVPMSYEVPGATREEEFATCDQSIYGSYGISGGASPERYGLGPGEISELWILDVDGSIVFIEAFYSPATPTELVEALRAMAESATFQIP